MISKQAIKIYLDAKLDEWNWMKQIPEEDLWEEVKHYIPDYSWKKFKPFNSQLVGLLLGIYHPGFLYFYDMGLGKSRIVLDAISYRKKRNEIKKTLVVCQNTTMIGNWEDEVVAHTNFSSVGLKGTREERWDLVRSKEADIYIVNYTGFQTMLTESQVVKGKKNKKWIPIKELIEELSSYFDSIVYDEIHLCKNRKSLNFELCNEFSRRYKFRYGLTGTPFGGDPMDLWAQFYLVDRGLTLGSTISMFREAFFDGNPGYFGGWEYKFRKNLKDLLHMKIRHRSIRYEESEQLDLPPKMYKRISLQFPNENAVYYKRAIEGLLKAKGQDIHQKENAYHKLRQIASGFVDIKDEDNIRERITFKENPKLEMLLDLVTSIPEKAKMIVFNEYTGSGDLIEKLFKSNKIQYKRLYSGTKDKEDARQTFLKDEKCKVFLANSKSGGVGLNLQVANYVVFYESPDDNIARAQAEKRAHRSGQVNTVFYYDLVMKNSIDEKILKSLKEGKSLFNSIINNDKTLETEALKMLAEFEKNENVS